VEIVLFLLIFELVLFLIELVLLFIIIIDVNCLLERILVSEEKLSEV